MSDKDKASEEKLRGIGSRMLEKLGGKPKPGGAMDGFRTGLAAQHIDFEEALRSANTAADPEKYRRAADGKDEKTVSKPFERDLFKNMEAAKKKVEAQRAGLTDDEKATDEAFREKNIASKIKAINSAMDRKGTDSLSSEIMGYDVTILRVPDETTKVVATCGGKPVEVKRDLSGDEVSMDGDHPEISLDMVKRAAAEMGRDGRTHWAADTPAGDRVEINMKAMYGDIPVSVDPSLKGDEIRFVKKEGVSLFQSLSGQDAYSRILASPDVWDKAEANLVKGKGVSRAWEMAAGDGQSIRFTMDAKVNGYDAIPERRIGNNGVRIIGGKVFVGKDVLKKAAKTMNDEKSTSTKIVTDGGRELEFRRGGKLKMYVNGNEIPDAQFKDALAEVSGLNDSKKFADGAKAGRMAANQVEIQGARSVVGIALNTPSAIMRSSEKSSSFISQILSMLMQQISRAPTISR